ncbi:MAG: hypothetical protein GY746_11650 [Gammaproteobacteria bacterium]|nr:hypothetical protein [Gammaproteobacteria bacterium]
MSSKAPTPFGAGSGSKVDSKSSAAPSGSGAYPPMSSKAPTPFSAGSGSKVDSKSSAAPSGSGGYPPISSKVPNIFGEKPPTATDITVQTKPKPIGGEYRSIRSRAVAPSQAKGVVASTGEAGAMKSMSVYEHNTWDVISSFDVTLLELCRWHGLLEEDWKEEFGKCVESALNASRSLRNDLCSLEASLQVGERDIHEAKGSIAELKWQTVETCSLVLEASSPNYLRLLETQELEKPAAELRDAISLSAAKLADTIVTLQQVLSLRANLREGSGVDQPENPSHALMNFFQSSSQPKYAGRISFGGSTQKRLGFGYGAKPRRGSSEKLNLEKGPQLVRIGAHHRAGCTEGSSSGNGRSSQPPTTSPAAMALLRIVSSTYQRSKEAEATWQGLQNTSSIVEEELLSKRSSTAIHKGQVGKAKAPQDGGGHGFATNSNNRNSQVNNAQLKRHWKQKLLCLLMDEAGMCAADHVTEISSHACSSYSLPLLGSQPVATSVSDILKEKQKRVSLLLPSGTLSGLPEMPDLPMPIAPPKMAARIPEKGSIVWPAAASKPGESSRKMFPSLTFESSSSKASATTSAGPITTVAAPLGVAATSLVETHKEQATAVSGAANKGLSKLMGACNTAPSKVPNAFPIPGGSSTVETQVTSFQGRDTNPPAISSVKKTEKAPETINKQQLVSNSKATVAAPEKDSSSGTAPSKASISKSLFHGSSATTQVPSTNSGAEAVPSNSISDPSILDAKLPSSPPSELKGGTLGTSSSSSRFGSLPSEPATKKEGLGVTPTLKSSAAGGFLRTPIKSLFGNLSAAPDITPSSSSDPKNNTASGVSVSEPLTTTPTVTTLPVKSSSNQVDDIRVEIVKIYEVHNASKVGNVDQLLAKYKGNEQILLARIKEKYSKVTTANSSAASNAPGAPQTQVATPPATSSVFGSSLGSLGTLSANQPAARSLFGGPKSGGGPSPTEGPIFGTSASKVTNINPFGGATSTQQQYQVSTFSPSPATTNTIVAPFGTMGGRASTSTPPAAFSSTSMTAAPSSNSLGMLRQWMLSVYQKHDPPRASKVDSLLAKYHGKEAVVVTRLVHKYNEQPPQELQAVLQSLQPQQQQQQQAPHQGSFGGSSFGMGGGGVFGTQHQPQRGFGVAPSSTSGTTPAVQSMTGSGVTAGFGSAFGASSGGFGLQGQKSESGFGGSSSVSKGQGGFGTLAQQQPQSGTFGMSNTFAAEASKPNAFTDASFRQMRG